MGGSRLWRLAQPPEGAMPTRGQTTFRLARSCGSCARCRGRSPPALWRRAGSD